MEAYLRPKPNADCSGSPAFSCWSIAVKNRSGSKSFGFGKYFSSCNIDLQAMRQFINWILVESLSITICLPRWSSLLAENSLYKHRLAAADEEGLQLSELSNQFLSLSYLTYLRAQTDSILKVPSRSRWCMAMIPCPWISEDDLFQLLNQSLSGLCLGHAEIGPLLEWRRKSKMASSRYHTISITTLLWIVFTYSVWTTCK